jgi:hypothetical protein
VRYNIMNQEFSLTIINHLVRFWVWRRRIRWRWLVLSFSTSQLALKQHYLHTKLLTKAFGQVRPKFSITSYLSYDISK